MPTFLNRETEKTPDAPSAGSDGSNAAESDSQKLHYRLEDLMQNEHVASLFLQHLKPKHSAVSRVSKVWRKAWMTTVAKQPWLRPAPTQPASLESVRNVDEMTVLPDGERLYVATQRGDVDDGDTYDLVLLDRSFNVLERQTDLPTATPGDCPHMLHAARLLRVGRPGVLARLRRVRS